MPALSVGHRSQESSVSQSSPRAQLQRVHNPLGGPVMPWRDDEASFVASYALKDRNKEGRQPISMLGRAGAITREEAGLYRPWFLRHRINAMR